MTRNYGRCATTLSGGWPGQREPRAPRCMAPGSRGCWPWPCPPIQTARPGPPWTKRGRCITWLDEPGNSSRRPGRGGHGPRFDGSGHVPRAFQHATANTVTIWLSARHARPAASPAIARSVNARRWAGQPGARSSWPSSPRTMRRRPSPPPSRRCAGRPAFGLDHRGRRQLLRRHQRSESAVRAERYVLSRQKPRGCRPLSWGSQGRPGRLGGPAPRYRLPFRR